ncbi:MAG: hypothetical protein Q9184_003602, partial [Pyrenodesmia sp. 2 TL-2023]
MASRALAALTTIISKGIPLGVLSGSTRWFNGGNNNDDPESAQPVTLGSWEGSSNNRAK